VISVGLVAAPRGWDLAAGAIAEALGGAASSPPMSFHISGPALERGAPREARAGDASNRFYSAVFPALSDFGAFLIARLAVRALRLLRFKPLPFLQLSDAGRSNTFQNLQMDMRQPIEERTR